MGKEDHDIKYDSQEISDIDLLNCTKEADQKYDSEDDIGFDSMFSIDQPIQKCDYNTCMSSISPFSENGEEKTNQIPIQISKLDTVRKKNVTSLLMRSQTMKKKFIVCKKKIMIRNFVQRMFLTKICLVL